MEQSNTDPNSDEKLMSALAYFFGVMGAILVWIFQKEKSRFVRFHATQALAFDFIVMGLSFVLFFCIFGAVFLGMLGSILITANSSSASDTPLFMMVPAFMPFMLFLCVFPLSLVLLILRFIAAISVLSGRDFRYPWLGKQVERFLGG
jgi:uncharacterized Tic20 family protein